MNYRFSTFTPIRQDVIVIHADDLRRGIHGFQTSLAKKFVPCEAVKATLVHYTTKLSNRIDPISNSVTKVNNFSTME